MSKFCGKVGYVETVETDPVNNPGVFESVVTERTYHGDVTKDYRRYNAGESINDNVNVGNNISIIADPYAYSHLPMIKYVIWMGVKWKVSSFEIQRPRVTLSISEVYNG